MSKQNLVYVWSLRNAAADKAGQLIAYKGAQRYMRSPLEYLAEALGTTELGEHFSLQAVIFDDDEDLPADREKLQEYGFRCSPTRPWFYPAELKAQGRRLNDLLIPIPSRYRRHPKHSVERVPGKAEFEATVLAQLVELKADLVVLDGLLVILENLAQAGNPFDRRIVNIHPGITRMQSPYERRGAYATLDALYGARGLRIVDWETMASRPMPPSFMTGASFHYVDTGIDSGEVIVDVLNTRIEPTDTIHELRWNNFNNSLFPALYQGLMTMAQRRANAGRTAVAM